MAQVVGVCPRLTNHHLRVIVDNFSWAEAHGWWFIDESDSNSSKVGGKELNVVDSTR